jgi:hypothetical protein
MQPLLISDPPADGLARRPAEPAALNPLTLLQTAIERGMNPDQLGKLMDMADRWEAAQAAKAFAAAVTAFQAELPEVIKRRTGGKDGAYTYAAFEDIMEVAGPVLARHRIVVTFSTDDLPNNRLKIVCRVRVGVHVEETAFVIPVPGRIGGENTTNETQRQGAALSYGKRYCFCAALNVVVAREDNDAATLFQLVTPNELAQLKAMAKERDVNIPGFMKRLKVESDDLAHIPRDRFGTAITMMKGKPIPTTPKTEAAK